MSVNMRVLLILLVGLLCAVASGQSRQAVLELADGTKVSGRVLRLDTDSVVLLVGNSEREYGKRHIRSCVFSDVPGLSRDEEPNAAQPVVSADGPASAHAPIAAASEQRAGVQSRPTVRSGRRLWHQRIQAMDLRFPWLFPAEPLQWISLGIMLFALLSLAVHFGARIAATEPVTFGRATGLALWFLMSGVAQVALVPGVAPAVVGCIIVNSILALLMFKLAYGLSVGAGVIAFVLLNIQAGVGYALLLLIDATLRSIGNTTF